MRSAAAGLHQARLIARGGFDVVEGLVDRELRGLLLQEALALYPTSNRTDVSVSDDEEMRGGSPARGFWSVGGGGVQTALYGAEWFLTALGEITGLTVEPTGFRATYTYYMRAGDHLGIHRDVEECDVAAISCLHDDGADRTESGLLCLYPERTSETLSVLRSTPERGAVRVRLAPAQTIVMFGGYVPHAVLPLESAHIRVVSVMCFRLIGDGRGGSAAQESSIRPQSPAGRHGGHGNRLTT
jgi:hypothetical protein